MTKSETLIFIEMFEDIGDIWTVEQVMDACGDFSLEDAIADRKASLSHLVDIAETVLNR